jgi:hypothetical protein
VTDLLTPPQVAVTVWLPIELHLVVKLAPLPVAGLADALVLQVTVSRLLPCAVSNWGSPANSEAFDGVIPVMLQALELELPPEPELPLEPLSPELSLELLSPELSLELLSPELSLELLSPELSPEPLSPELSLELLSPELSLELLSPELSLELLSPELSLELLSPELSLELLSPELSLELLSPELSLELLSPELSLELLSPELSLELLSPELSLELLSPELSLELLSPELSLELLYAASCGLTKRSLIFGRLSGVLPSTKGAAITLGRSCGSSGGSPSSKLGSRVTMSEVANSFVSEIRHITDGSSRRASINSRRSSSNILKEPLVA